MDESDRKRLGEQFLACVRGGVAVKDIQSFRELGADIAHDNYAALGTAAALKKPDMLREILRLWPKIPVETLDWARGVAHYSEREENWKILHDLIQERQAAGKRLKPPGHNLH